MMPILKTHLNNIKLAVQCADSNAEVLCILEKKIEGKKHELLEKNSFLTQLFLKAKQVLFGTADVHKKALKRVIEENVNALNQLDRKDFAKKNEAVYTELFITAQNYNHACHLASDVSYKEDVPLFKDLELQTLILPESCPELAPVVVRTTEAAEKMLYIPDDQQPLITEGFWRKRKVYHYSAEDVKISHGKEAARIFINTQTERIVSLFGSVFEYGAKIFGKEITFFNNSHYFRNREKIEDIYAKDAPIASHIYPTSYWIGHATCLLSIPLKSEQDKIIKVNILTDPVEGDLNKILYPRMTRPARKMEECPTPHIYLLSHNHLDHYDKETLKKLKQQQPIMLIPEGDLEKFRNLGFKNVYEHNWWQKTTLTVEQDCKKATIEITAVPAHHWSGQGPCDGHQAAFLGYVIHQQEGDIYFAGDTARLSEGHIDTLRNRFNIRTMFQPGGPDEVRKDMKSTHQASVDALWMHFHLMVRSFYNKNRDKPKEVFIQEVKKMRTLFMHTKTYKLGNLHFDDTDVSVSRVKEALRKTTQHEKAETKGMKSYEKQVYKELLAIGSQWQFSGGSCLEANDILAILEEGVIIPKIGSLTELAKPGIELQPRKRC